MVRAAWRPDTPAPMIAIVFFDDVNNVDIEGAISLRFSPKMFKMRDGSRPGVGWLNNINEVVDEMHETLYV